MTAFEGFPEDFFRFFDDLRKNNERAWFNEHKARYVASVVEPTQAFIVAVAPLLHGISPHYIADPKAHGGSMFRIYRDTRFSQDKTPYKTHTGVQFRHQAGKDAHAPGFYVHLDSEGLFFGGGVWLPPNPVLNRIRDHIVDNARSWTRIRNAGAVQAAGGIRGDALKRPPRGYAADHPLIEDLKQKSFYVMQEHRPGLANSPDLVDETIAAFGDADPLMRYLCMALGAEF